MAKMCLNIASLPPLTMALCSGRFSLQYRYWDMNIFILFQFVVTILVAAMKENNNSNMIQITIVLRDVSTAALPIVQCC